MSENSNEPIELVKTLRPYHVWALGVGIVLVGEYMGWNFTVAKGGILGSLFALLVAGSMYIMVALCASELGSSTKLAGGPYDWARLFVGPGAAAIVGLAVYMEYIALEAADASVATRIRHGHREQMEHSSHDTSATGRGGRPRLRHAPLP